MALPTKPGDRGLSKGGNRDAVGFTLIELLVVMAILALLLSIAAPRYFDSVERAKEATLRTDLRMLREAIDKYRSDTGHLPDSLQSVVDRRYILAMPVDPVTDSAVDWVLVPHPDGTTPGVFDVKSGAPGQARDGSSFTSW
jgi:general secretion pathway protein G